MDIIKYTLFGLFSGVFGTAAGGILAYAFRIRGKRVLGMTMDFAAGFMLSVVCFDLLPGAFELAPLWQVLCGVAAGSLFVLLAQNFIHPHNPESDMAVTAAMMAAGIALHNFPEGLAIGAGFCESRHLGISIAAAIFIHNIPEGLSIGLPMRVSGRSLLRAALLTAVAGAPTGIGALIGAAAGGVGDTIIAICLACAAGAMMFLVLSEMLPSARQLWNGRSSDLGGIAGVICGIITCVALK